MAIFKIKDGTRIVCPILLTKQVIIELEDGRILGLRVKEDHNGTEFFYELKPSESRITRKSDWENEHDIEFEEELQAALDIFKDTMLFGEWKTGEEVDTNELMN